MSSVLKALRKQSSPYIPLRSSTQLTSAPVQRTWLKRLINGVLICLLLVVAGATGWWLAKPSAMEPPTVVTESQAPQYTLGTATSIRVPELAPATPAVDTGTVIEPSRIEPVVPQQPEAVDLNTVSPGLLSAFEDAIAATGTTGNQTASVVPELLTLSQAFQMSIPSFTYDGHQYSSRGSTRWIELSGQRLQEGDGWQGLTVIRIAPAHVVLAKSNQAFLQPALEDWTRP